VPGGGAVGAAVGPGVGGGGVADEASGAAGAWLPDELEAAGLGVADGLVRSVPGFARPGEAGGATLGGVDGGVLGEALGEDDGDDDGVGDGVGGGVGPPADVITRICWSVGTPTRASRSVPASRSALRITRRAGAATEA